VIVFTSGSTGPSKGVVYRHDQLQAQRDQLRDLYSIGPDDRLVAAFAPFALFGPALGITSAVPDMHVARPGTLTAAALGDAVADIDATLVFTSPAALTNVVGTAEELHGAELGGVRLVMSAGAPVSPALLGRTLELFPNADVHTPYGMTEVLPVADISLLELGTATGGAGVCVGRPCPGVTVAVSELDHLGAASGAPSTAIGVQGEIVIRAEHTKDRYDRLWLTEHRSRQPEGWHRSGDVGLVDHEGRLWIGGRLEHVIMTDRGPVTPVPVELAAEATEPVRRAAAVGIGPVGTQVIALVVETDDAPRRGRLASPELTDAVRAGVRRELDLSVAAVLEVGALPVDRRHNSKIDRSRVARWAGGVSAGKRWTRL
jgi:acyl-CoA synthetase (AMP-forming)/AMP-acid ligase II